MNNLTIKTLIWFSTQGGSIIIFSVILFNHFKQFFSGRLSLIRRWEVKVKLIDRRAQNLRNGEEKVLVELILVEKGERGEVMCDFNYIMSPAFCLCGW